MTNKYCLLLVLVIFSIGCLGANYVKAKVIVSNGMSNSEIIIDTISLLIALLVFSRFKITRQKSEETRRILESR